MIKREQQGAILLVSMIMVAVIAGIGVSFGSTANIHKKIVSAQAKNLDAKIKAASLRNVINNKIRQNTFAIGEAVNPCKGIPNCVFLNKADGAALTDLSRGKDKSWWEQNANQGTDTVPNSNTTDPSSGVLRYIIREVSTPKDDSKIYEIIAFAADANGKYQSVARQYQTIIDPAANVAPPPAAQAEEFPDWPTYRYTDAPNEQIFNTVMDKGLEIDSSSNITDIKSPGGAKLKVTGTIKLQGDMMVRDTGANNAAAVDVIDIKDNFVILVVGEVRTWPVKSSCTSCEYNAALVQFGTSGSIRAYVSGTDNTADPKYNARLFGFNAGVANSAPIEIYVIASKDAISDVSFKYNTDSYPGHMQDTDPFVAALRRLDGAKYTQVTAAKRGDLNIKFHPDINQSGGDLSGPSMLSIGPSQGGENPGAQVGIKEVRYIDRVFTDQELRDLIRSTMERYNFPV